MASHRPIDLTINRADGVLTITWADSHASIYPLVWLRLNCPCATCREERRQSFGDPLRLRTGPPPSAEVEGVELVGNYAVRFAWKDGHDTGIYGFVQLRASCPCPVCNPDGPAPLVSD